MSEWAKNFIAPLLQSPSIREFNVVGKNVVLIKVPSGNNKPYLFCNPSSGEFSIFVRTSGGTALLPPHQIKDFFREVITGEALATYQALSKEEEAKPAGKGMEKEDLAAALEPRQSRNIAKLEDPQGYGYFGIYCLPENKVTIDLSDIERFFINHRTDFSEAIRFFDQPEVEQDCVSVGFYPRAIRKDIKSTSRVTCYGDGITSLDAQLDFLMDKGKVLHIYWAAYEIQRQLQFTKAMLASYRVKTIHVVVDLKYISEHKIIFNPDSPINIVESPYSGYHRPIILKDLKLDDIYDYNGTKRNVTMPVVKQIVNKICTIFGLSKALPGVWDEEGYLVYVRGLESHR